MLTTIRYRCAFSLDYFILLLDHSVCWLETAGVKGYTPHRARGIKCPVQCADRALKLRNTQATFLITPDGPRTHVDGSLSRQVRFVGSGITLGDQAGDLKADVE